MNWKMDQTLPKGNYEIRLIKTRSGNQPCLGYIGKYDRSSSGGEGLGPEGGAEESKSDHIYMPTLLKQIHEQIEDF